MSSKPNLEKYYNNITFKRKNKTNTNTISTSDIDSTDNIKSYVELYNNNITEFYSRIDDYDGFFTTQQIESIDYENFANHVFFDSAVEKVNYAYNNILNYFPYDKDFFTFDQYKKSLSGFEKYLLKEKIAKSINYFGTEGSYYIDVKDENGKVLKDFDGLPKFDNFNPKDKDFSFDFQLYIDNSSNEGIIFSYEDYDSSQSSVLQGIYLLLVSGQDSEKNLVFIIKQTQNLELKHTIQNVEFNKFFHLNLSIESFFDGEDKKRRLLVYKDCNLIHRGLTEILDFDSFSNKNNSFYIGYKNPESPAITYENSNVDNIFKGAVDEFRYYIGRARDQEKITKEKNVNVYSSDYLALYLKFNEPNGNYLNNFLVIDSSGKKLHGLVKNSDNNVPDDYDKNSSLNSIKIPLAYENLLDNPVLFSNYLQNSSSKNSLIEEARFYDLENPNSFWKLMPKNIFIEGSDFDSVKEVYINEEIQSNSKKLGDSKVVNQTLVKLFSIWARFFDQLKLYIDSLSEVLNIEYDSINDNKKVDGVILPLAIKSIGFDFKELFESPVTEKLDNKNLKYEKELSDISVRQIQNILWKRFLINSNDFLRSKGTIRSIHNIFNSFGLEADRFIKIKEITSQNLFNVDNNFYEKVVYKDFIDFSQLNNTPFAYTDNAIDSSQNNSNNFYRLPNSQFLTFTSYDNRSLAEEFIKIDENWTFECLYQFDNSKIEVLDKDQSLVRLNVGSAPPYGVIETNNNVSPNANTDLLNDALKFQGPYVNVVFKRNKTSLSKGSVILEVDHLFGNGIESEITSRSQGKVTIDNIDLMNGQIYMLVIRRKRLGSYTSRYYMSVSPIGDSSYSATVNNASLDLSNKFYYRSDNPLITAVDVRSEDYKVILPEFAITNKLNITVGPERYKNEIESQRAVAFNKLQSYIVNFQGFMTNLRMFNRFISDEELRIKRKDIDIIADESSIESSLEKTLLNIELRENIAEQYKSSVLEVYNVIELISIISNDNSEKMSSFLIKPDSVVSPRKMFYRDKIKVLKQSSEVDSPHFYNNVYINTFSSDAYKKEFLNSNESSLTQVPPGFVYNEDLRIYIDFSMVNFLNQDINKIILTNEYFTKRLSLTNNLYEEEYKSLSNLRDVYFKRLEKDLNIDTLYQVYKYFDNILSDLLEEAIPSKVNYLGFNFVYESHILERNKYRHKMSNSRLPAVDINNYSNYKVYDKKIRVDDSLDLN